MKTKTTEKRSDGSWEKYQYNDQGLLIRFEASTGYWRKYTYNDQGLEIRRDDSNGSWINNDYNDYNDQGELINTKHCKKETKLETIISLLRKIDSNTQLMLNN